MENESSVSLKWLLTSGTVDLNPEQVPLSKDTVSFGTQKTRPVVLQIKCHAIQGLFWILPVLNGPHTATDGNVAKGHLENGDHGQRGQPKITAVLKKDSFRVNTGTSGQFKLDNSNKCMQLEQIAIQTHVHCV